MIDIHGIIGITKCKQIKDMLISYFWIILARPYLVSLQNPPKEEVTFIPEMNVPQIFPASPMGNLFAMLDAQMSGVQQFDYLLLPKYILEQQQKDWAELYLNRGLGDAPQIIIEMMKLSEEYLEEGGLAVLFLPIFEKLHLYNYDNRVIYIYIYI